MTADVGYFCREVSAEIHRQVSRLGLAPHQVVLNASHSHSSPAICRVLDLIEENQIDPRYLDYFITQVVGTIARSLRDLCSAQLSISEAVCDVCINKRLDGRMEPNPFGPVDRRVRTLIVRAAKDNALRAVLFLFGCHPSDMRDDAFGGDFFGFAREELEHSYPGVVWLSAQGMGGDARVDHRDPSGKNFFWGNLSNIADTRSYGKRLAKSVEMALKNSSIQVKGRISTATRQLELPLGEPVSRETALLAASDNDAWRARWGGRLVALYDQRADLPRSMPYSIQVLRIGSRFKLVALDGEVFTRIGEQIEQRLKPAHTFVLGYSNSAAGYIPTADEIAKGGYEIEVYYWWLVPAPFASDVEKSVVDDAVSLAW